MLSFTHDSKRKENDPYKILTDEEYQPITITNVDGARKKLMPEPEVPKKSVTSTIKDKKYKKSVGRTQKPAKSKTKTLQLEQWNNDGVKKNSRGNLYSNDLKKQQLGAQQRQFKAQERIRQNIQLVNKLKYERKSQKQRKADSQQLVEQKIKNMNQRSQTNKLPAQYELTLNKQRDILLKQQQNQIEQLKKLVRRQKQQKDQNNKKYDQAKRQIQIKRNQFIDLQKKLQWQIASDKQKMQIKNKIRQIQNEQYPSTDLPRKKQEFNYNKTKNYQSFPEITQSQSLAKQQSKIREGQLEYLIDHRQRNFNQFKKNTMGYNPTLIPLISKASYKIISTQISSIVELLVDDLLYQQVNLLEAIQLEAKAQQFKEKQKQTVNDYVKKLEDLAYETQQIQSRLGKYSQMKFEDIYKYPSINYLSQTNRSAFTYSPNLFCKLQSKLTEDQTEEIEHRVDRFKKYVNSFEEYKINHLKMFEQVTQQLINQALLRLAKELDNGAGEFVNIVFRSQFD